MICLNVSWRDNFKKEIADNKIMEELIKENVEKVKKSWEENGVDEYKEEDVRLCVYEDLRDCLKVLMSDVSY